jgi:peptide chain release factor 2
MLVDTLRERIKSIEKDISTIKTFWRQASLEKNYQTLETITHTEDFWTNPKQAAILKELQKIRSLRDQYNDMCRTYDELPELIELFANDEQELQKLNIEMNRFYKNMHSLKIALLLSKPHDHVYCFLSINSGAGGTESQDWALMLLRMYMRFCEHQGLAVEVIDEQPGEEAGIKSATLYIKGENAYGLFKGEQGVHRLVRISPFDANKRRHTSFVGILVIPEEPEITIEINPNDLRIDTYRAGGAGGQHVNKTDSAVRITHIPTGIVVQCQNQRSQTQNKATALKMLTAKLAQRAEEDRNAQHAGVEKRRIEWGSQIRSYVLQPYKMVKDHRTDYESYQPDLVLNGDLMPFIEAFLIWEGQTEAAVLSTNKS